MEKNRTVEQVLITEINNVNHVNNLNNRPEIFTQRLRASDCSINFVWDRSGSCNNFYMQSIILVSLDIGEVLISKAVLGKVAL